MGDIDLINVRVKDANYGATNLTMAAGGTGYTTGDQVKISSAGVGSADVTATVTASGGVVSSLTLTANGSFYNTGRPGIAADGVTASPVAATTVTGSGAGLTLNVTWSQKVAKKTMPIYNAGTLNRLNIRGGQFLDVDCLFFSNTAVSGGNPTVTIDGALISGTYLINSSSAVALKGINLANLVSETGQSLYRLWSINHTTGNVPVSITACKGLSVGNAAVSYQGAGGTVTATSLDMPLDITQAGFVKTTAGQLVLTKATAGTIPAGRLAACNGTAWKCIDDTSLTY